MVEIVMSFLTAFTLSYMSMPSIINIAKAKKLYDVPGDRSSHFVNTPSLGGIGIFAAAIFSIVLWTPFEDFGNLQYILCSFIIVFLIGVRDDLMTITPLQKIGGQFLAAAILIYKSDVVLTGFYGLFGIEELPNWFSHPFTFLTFLVIINAFNLIDGINGLAGSIAALITTTLGVWFFIVDHMEFAIIAFATAGAVIAFLRYNYSPAKIFMGDTGSLLVGLVCAVLIISFIDLNNNLSDLQPYKFEGIPVVAISIMILPLFDTVRVFITRIMRGHSPFQPDRRHIHHLLIDFGFSHMQATLLLVFVNMLFISLVFLLHSRVKDYLLLAVVLLTAVILTYSLHMGVVRKNQSREKTR